MNFHEYWVEIISLFVLVLGLIFALSTIGSAFMAYLIIFLWGMFFGRVWYRFRNSFRFTWGVVIFGFLLGFILGSMNYGSITVITISYQRPFPYSLSTILTPGR